MALTAANVRVGTADPVTGGVYSAIAGTAIPVTAVAALNAAFQHLGYISEDGVTQSIGSDITTIKAWQGGATVRKIQTSFDLTYQFEMIETESESLFEYYGNFTPGTGSSIGPTALLHRRYVVQMVDGSDLIRIVVPDGQILERGDVVYKTDTAVGYPVTVTAYPDAAGFNAYMYMSGPDS